MAEEDRKAEVSRSVLRTRQFRIWMLTLVGVVLLVMTALLRSVTTPILVALVIAYILDPVVRALERARIRRWLAVAVVYLAMLGALGFVIVTVVPPLYRQASKLPAFVDHLASQLKVPPAEEGADQGAAQTPETPQPEPTPSPEDAAGPALSSNLLQTAIEAARPHMDQIAVSALKLFREAVQRVLASIGEVIGTIVQVILVFVYTFFFLLGLHPFYQRVKGYLPGRHREEILRVLGRLDKAYSSFFRGRLIVALTSGVLTSIGLWIVGIPFWLLIGMGVGVLGIIPVVGVLIGLIPALLLGALTGGWSMVIGVLIVFAAVQLVEPVLTPLVLAHGVKLHPITILIGLLVGAKVFGMFGAMIAVPLVSTVKTLSEEFLLPPLRELAEEKAP
jgi:predicted PurR-regulated permease PerM